MPRPWVPFGGFPQMSGAGNSAVLSQAAPLLLLRERNPFFFFPALSLGKSLALFGAGGRAPLPSPPRAVLKGWARPQRQTSTSARVFSPPVFSENFATICQLWWDQPVFPIHSQRRLFLHSRAAGSSLKIREGSVRDRESTPIWELPSQKLPIPFCF